jgi:predicted RNA binding protein YcfA (HicA-like mRNA interferase family)
MPKLPRDISGIKLASLLKKYGYRITRQTGSHIRLTSRYTKEEHNITIPAHNPIKIGTLNNILKEVAEYLGITKEELIKNLFG